MDVTDLAVGNHTDPVQLFEYAKCLVASLPSEELRQIPSKSGSLDEH